MMTNLGPREQTYQGGEEGESDNGQGVPVKFIDVGKTYQTADGPLEAVGGISLTIGPGEFFSVVGPSGCGKTTLLMLASGLIPSTKGRILIGEKEVTEPYTDLGIVFQRDILMDWRSVYLNVMVPVEIKKSKPIERYMDRASELLAMVGLQGFENRYPSELSGGMRQRVSISRALITRPPLLLMDEPFGSLDALSREQMNDDLQQLWSNNRSTVLFITHNISEAVYMSDRIMVMSKRPGQILDLIEIDDLPRPRTPESRDMPEFQAHISRIRKIFITQGIIGSKSS